MVVIGLLGTRPLPPTGSFLKHFPLVEILLAMGLLAIVSMTLGLLISASVDTSEKTMPLLIVAVIFQVVMTGGVFSLAGKAGLEQVAWLAPSRWGFAATASTSNLNVIQLPVVPKPPAGQKQAGSKAHRHHITARGRARAPGRAARPRLAARPRRAPARPAPRRRASGTSGTATPSTAAKTKAPDKASPATTAPAKTTAPASSGTIAPDPLWKHNPATWLKDMIAMALLGLAFTLIAWWRLVRLSPGRRR